MCFIDRKPLARSLLLLCIHRIQVIWSAVAPGQALTTPLRVSSQVKAKVHVKTERQGSRETLAGWRLG